MRSIYILLMIWFCTLQSIARTPEFEFLCQRILSGNTSGNTRVLLNIQGENSGGIRQVHLNISFRQGYKTIYESDKYLELTGQDNLFDIRCDLAEGEYEAVAEVKYVDGGIPSIKSVLFRARSLEGPIQVSDITLLKPDLSGPVFRNEIRADAGGLYFTSGILSKQKGVFTARAILYRQDENPYADAAGKFTSISQISRQIQPPAGTEIAFEGHFDTEGLESGNYLIEIFIYQEDKIVAESAYAVYLTWKEVPRILANPGVYLPYMKWLSHGLSENSIASSPASFIEFWITQNSDREGYRYAAMEKYFRRIPLATQLTGVEDIWETDAGKHILLFGAPDSIRKYSVGADSIIIWMYRNPPLTKYFIKPRNETLPREISLSDKIRLSIA